MEPFLVAQGGIVTENSVYHVALRTEKMSKAKQEEEARKKKSPTRYGHVSELSSDERVCTLGCRE